MAQQVASQVGVVLASAVYEEQDSVGSTYFLLHDLYPGSKMTLHFTRTAPRAPPLPRARADAIPFTSAKIPEILSHLSIPAGSPTAAAIRSTLAKCEAPPLVGMAAQRCATSFESMVDFAASCLGTRDVHAAMMTMLIRKDRDIGRKDRDIGRKNEREVPRQDIGRKDRDIGRKDRDIGRKDEREVPRQDDIGRKDRDIRRKDEREVSRKNEREVPRQAYEVESVRPMAVAAGGDMVACHRVPYPYAVFAWHTTTATLYAVTLSGVDGTKADAVTACHRDATPGLWGPMYKKLGVVPGSTPVCHFLPQDSMLWMRK